MQEEDGAAQTIPAVSPTLLQHPQELGAPFIPVSSFFSLIYNLNETSAQKFYIYIISQDTEQWWWAPGSGHLRLCWRKKHPLTKLSLLCVVSFEKNEGSNSVLLKLPRLEKHNCSSRDRGGLWAGLHSG